MESYLCERQYIYRMSLTVSLTISYGRSQSTSFSLLDRGGGWMGFEGGDKVNVMFNLMLNKYKDGENLMF